MKHTYILIALWVGVCMAACTHQEPPYFEASANGAYFHKEKNKQLVKADTINFGLYAVENPTEIYDTLVVKLLGYPSSTADRRLVLKTKAVEGYEPAAVELPEIYLQKDSMQCLVPIKVLKPQTTDQHFAICVYLDAEDSSSGLGSGIAGQNEYIIYVQESYQKPVNWDNGGYGMYLGGWTPEKHIFLARVMKNNNYASKSSVWDGTGADINKKAIDSLRTFRQNNPNETVSIEIPFSNEVRYDKPFYWTDRHNHYLGAYSARVFANLAKAVNANSANELDMLAGDEARMKTLNKMGVEAMMSEYNSVFTWPAPGVAYRSRMWIPMLAGENYTLIRPTAWHMPEPSALLEQYYGPYSEDKYRFMINAWLEHKGSTDFVLMQMFPVSFVWGDKGREAFWDSTVGGEEQIKACYRVFKAAYAGLENPSFTFPEHNL